MQRARCCSGCTNGPGRSRSLCGCPTDGPEQFRVTETGQLWAGPWGDCLMELGPEFSPHLANSWAPPENECFRGGMQPDS